MFNARGCALHTCRTVCAPARSARRLRTDVNRNIQRKRVDVAGTQLQGPSTVVISPPTEQPPHTFRQTALQKPTQDSTVGYNSDDAAVIAVQTSDLLPTAAYRYTLT